MADEKSPTEEEEPQKKPSDNSVGQAAVPAFYIDTWFTSTWRGHVRIAFGEQLIEKKASYRTAIVMEFDDVDRLIAHLQRVVAKRRETDAPKMNTEQD